MTLVKPLYDQTLDLDDFEPKHLGYLLERVQRRMRRDLGRLPGALDFRAAHQPLTPSYFRVVSLVPAAGAGMTDLAVPAQMTKQAFGQYVDALVEHGYLTVERGERDRRVRIVRRTEKGDQLIAQVNALYGELDARWRDLLGSERWAQFRDP